MRALVAAYTLRAVAHTLINKKTQPQSRECVSPLSYLNPVHTWSSLDMRLAKYLSYYNSGSSLALVQQNN